MNKFPVILILSTGLLTSCFSSSAPETTQKESVAEIEPLKVKFCELAKSPESFAGKKIILKGIYVLHYHSFNFFSFNCQSEIPFMLSHVKPQPCDEKSEVDEFDYSGVMISRAHGVIVRGQLNNQLKTMMASYGKVEYYEFEVECFEKLVKFGWLSSKQSEKQRRQMDEFESSEN